MIYLDLACRLEGVHPPGVMFVTQRGDPSPSVLSNPLQGYVMHLT